MLYCKNVQECHISSKLSLPNLPNPSKLLHHLHRNALARSIRLHLQCHHQKAEPHNFWSYSARTGNGLMLIVPVYSNQLVLNWAIQSFESFGRCLSLSLLGTKISHVYRKSRSSTNVLLSYNNCQGNWSKNDGS